jgi:hypothetical protein
VLVNGDKVDSSVDFAIEHIEEIVEVLKDVKSKV